MSNPRKRSSRSRNKGLLWAHYAQHSLLFQNLHSVIEQPDLLEWERLFSRVDMHWFYRHRDHGPAAGLIRFKPGGRVPLHEHRGFEHIFVLSGSQMDENGLLQAGGFKVHAPGTRHSIFSKEGCLVLAIYEKRARFLRSAARR